MARFALIAAGFAALVFCTTASALSCGSYDGYHCHNSADQFAAAFNPPAPYGGFGGGNCQAGRTPVIFVHGNTDSALGWDAPPDPVAGYPAPPHSVYDQFRASGYNDCELFGVTYLAPEDQGFGVEQYNYHEPSQYAIIHDFIQAVKAYTGYDRVDIVGHSMGASVALAALEYYNDWNEVRRFVNIAGGIRGLASCYYTGYANPYAPTCGSENYYNTYVFGFFPEGWYGGTYVDNDWTGTGTRRAMREMPAYHPGIAFYTITAGWHDQIHCMTTTGWSSCGYGANFYGYSNVRAQLFVGAGSYAPEYDWNWADGTPVKKDGGDIDGVGHFNARNNTGVIIHRMLATECSGIGCASGYAYGPVSQ